MRSRRGQRTLPSQAEQASRQGRRWRTRRGTLAPSPPQPPGPSACRPATRPHGAGRRLRHRACSSGGESSEKRLPLPRQGQLPGPSHTRPLPHGFCHTAADQCMPNTACSSTTTTSHPRSHLQSSRPLAGRGPTGPPPPSECCTRPPCAASRDPAPPAAPPPPPPAPRPHPPAAAAPPRPRRAAPPRRPVQGRWRRRGVGGRSGSAEMGRRRQPARNGRLPRCCCRRHAADAQ